MATFHSRRGTSIKKNCRTTMKNSSSVFQAWFKLELQKTLLIPPPNRQVHRQFGGGLGGPQVMLAVMLEEKNPPPPPPPNSPRGLGEALSVTQKSMVSNHTVFQ
jgi:hypothetical protein